jgi:hypothetical protein
VNAIDVEEHESSQQRCALVAVNERVVARDVKQVGRCHREQPLVALLLAEGDRGCASADSSRPNSRTPLPPPYCLERKSMELQRVLNVEELGVIPTHLASFRKVASSAFVIRAADARTRAFLSFGAGRDDQRLAVSADLERRILVDVEQVKDGPLDE